jgi:hypothetical protein
MSDKVSTYTYIDTDGEAYNRGRAEGNADVAVELRKLVDPLDKEHLNLTGTLKKVELLLAENERLRKQISDEHNRAMTYMNDLMGANNEIECLRAERDKALADNERLRESLASSEATWYLCHDGSEDACCKAHD